MSIGKKIYASFWLVTGIFLIVFIVIVSVFATKIGPSKTKGDGHYAIALNPDGAAGAAPKYSDIVLSDGKKLSDVFNTQNVTQPPYDIYVLDKTTTGNSFLDSDGKAHSWYSWATSNDEFSEGNKSGKWAEKFLPTDSEAKNQNAVAGIGLVFAISLMSAVGATVYVSVTEKKHKALSGGKK